MDSAEDLLKAIQNSFIVAIVAGRKLRLVQDFDEENNDISELSGHH